MNCLILIFGESFRMGSQYTRIRGTSESFNEQINACKTHINFFKYLEYKYNLKISVSLLTYQTNFDKDLLNIYQNYLIKFESLDNLIGLNGLFHRSYSKINLNYFNFILYFRIDLFLKNDFFKIFNPYWNTIKFANILWTKNQICNNYPTINDMTIFIPKKYFIYLSNFDLTTHCIWKILIENTKLTNNDLNVMINTYHDSDSQKDFNPLYYIVNRPQNNIWYDKGKIFNKNLLY